MAECVDGSASKCKEVLPGVANQARRIAINVAHTQYKVVKEVARSLGWQLSVRVDNSDWDVLWTDTAVQPETLTRMKGYQKINHFPGTYMITRKNLLARNLNKMRKLHPAEYSFFPRTWVFPAESTEAKTSNLGMYIVKPEASCQGKGIFLSRSLDGISSDSRCVVQEYVKNPLLIDGFKFDMRIYVLLTGCSPLRAFVHREGLVRLATNAYAPPTTANLHEQYMHLTNYAINKTNQAFVKNEDPAANAGHKRSLSSLWKWLHDQEYNVRTLWTQVKLLIARTLVSIQPSLAHMYKACQPNDPSNSMCFELLGFDILLDSSLKPWLLEVNHSPSFTTDSQLDLVVKSQVIREAFTILNVSAQHKQLFEQRRKARLHQYVFPRSRLEQREQRLNECAAAQSERNEWERTHLGDFEKVEFEEQMHLVKTAYDLWERWTGPARIERPDRPVTQCVLKRLEPQLSPRVVRKEIQRTLRLSSRHVVPRPLMSGTQPVRAASTSKRHATEMIAKLDLALGNVSRIAKRKSWHIRGNTK